MKRLFSIASYLLILIVSCSAASAQTSNATLRVAMFGGQFGALQKIYTGDRLKRLTGMNVEWVQGNPSDFLAQMIASRGRKPPFDVVALDEPVQAAAIKAGLLMKMDPAKIPNLAKVYPEIRNAEGYGPGFVLYSFGLVFNTEKLKAAGIPVPTSWNDLWDPKLAGHVAVPELSLPQGAAFALKIALMNGGNEGNLKPGLDKIAQIKAQSYYSSSATLETLVTSGEVWMSATTSGRGWGLVDRGLPIGFVVPKEGTVAGQDMIDIVAGTDKIEEASKFIDTILDPISQVGMASEMSYGPTNSAAAKVFADYPDVARKFPSSIAAVKELFTPNWQKYNDNIKEAADYWNRNVRK
jgi:putative spermidine/putrescine transport system substrate-binding protein